MRRFIQARLDASRERSEEDETVLGLALDEWVAHVRGETEKRDAAKGKGKRAVEESEEGSAAQKRTRRTKAGPSSARAAVNDTAAEEAPPTPPEVTAPANVEPSPAPSPAAFSTATPPRPHRKPAARRKQKEDPMAEVTSMMIGGVERLGDSVHESSRIASRPTAIENRLRPTRGSISRPAPADS